MRSKKHILKSASFNQVRIIH